jgi:hypothetical protein
MFAGGLPCTAAILLSIQRIFRGDLARSSDHAIGNKASRPMAAIAERLVA